MKIRKGKKEKNEKEGVMGGKGEWGGAHDQTYYQLLIYILI